LVAPPVDTRYRGWGRRISVHRPGAEARRPGGSGDYLVARLRRRGGTCSQFRCLAGPVRRRAGAGRLGDPSRLRRAGAGRRAGGRSTMKQIWERIHTWLRQHAPAVLDSLRPGATEETLRAAEEAMGVKLPADVRQSYRIHDGQSAGEHGFAPGLIEGLE